MNKKRFSTSDITIAAMFVALMAIGANATAMVTVGTVPLTFQTVIAILAGALLGSRLGTFSMIGYIAIGLAGLPIFSGLTGGFGTLTVSTFGFILSFPIIALVTGLIIERKGSFLLAAIAGLITNYAIGVPYLYIHTAFILQIPNISFVALSLGMVPFFIKDSILAVFASVLAPRIKRAVSYNRINKRAA
ncbi:biotin transporter BioY [Paenalkalicoccus suaedae]|uniref:Biotin transporter n=1 Tax=Paenalkalicoccus suaedae TaxID=2592382 RepID=A0A859FHA2_9BACI|nr:biotin transporter BioY [Paenalkalicoccus suaedae]QKS72170.1 biotin transporter BioY [Paenalkalicoccus suaedae]